MEVYDDQQKTTQQRLKGWFKIFGWGIFLPGALHYA